MRNRIVSTRPTMSIHDDDERKTSAYMSSIGPSNYSLRRSSAYSGYMANEHGQGKEDDPNGIQIIGGQFSSEPLEAARPTPQANLVNCQLGTLLRPVLVNMGMSDAMIEAPETPNSISPTTPRSISRPHGDNGIYPSNREPSGIFSRERSIEVLQTSWWQWPSVRVPLCIGNICTDYTNGGA